MWRPWSGSVVESARGIVRDENHGEDVMKPRQAGSGHHLTKRQQAAILTVICYAEKKGLASPVADTVKILGLRRSTVYEVKTQICSPRKRGPIAAHRIQRVDILQRIDLTYDAYKKIK